MRREMILTNLLQMLLQSAQGCGHNLVIWNWCTQAILVNIMVGKHSL